MQRAKLLAAAKIVSPALGVGSLSPTLSQLCFEKGTVTAYNGSIALRVGCVVDFDGAISGSQLIALLDNSQALDCDCAVADFAVTFKLGRTQARFVLTPAADFIFKAPIRSGNKVILNSALRQAFSIVTRSIGRDPAFLYRLGITLVFDKKQVRFYASDDVTLICASIPCRSSDLVGTKLILTSGFCEQLLRLGDDVDLFFTTDNAVIGVSKSGLELFGGVLTNADPKQFEQVFDQVVPDSLILVEIPKTLAHCLQRALIVSKDIDTTFDYADGRLSIMTSCLSCEVRDRVKIDLGEVPFSITTCAEYVSRYLDVSTRIGFSSRCIVLEGDTFRVLVGVKNNTKKELVK